MKNHKRLLWTITGQQIDSLEEMDKLLEVYNVQKLNHEEIVNLNKLITTKENKSVIKNILTEGWDHMASLVNSIKHLKID